VTYGEKWSKQWTAEKPSDDPADDFFTRLARRGLFDKISADLEQPAISHTRRTRGFTGTTRQTPVQVKPSSFGALILFQDPLDQVNPPAGAIQFIA